MKSANLGLGFVFLSLTMMVGFQNCKPGQFKANIEESPVQSSSSSGQEPPDSLPAATSTTTTTTSTSTTITLNSTPDPDQSGPAGQDASLYVLTFQDSFDSGASFDPSKWSTDIWYKANNPTKNYNVSGGNLNIWPQQDSSGQFFDRTIVSDNKFEQLYGFFEIEAKLPIGAGLHPVVSLVNTNGPEIAIMHAYTGAPNGAWSTSDLHPLDFVVTACPSPDNYLVDARAHNFLNVPDLSAGFHKYGVRWDATTIRYYFDGVQVGPAYNHSVIRSPMYFYIGLWMVNEETSPNVNNTPQGVGNSFKINSVRAWKFK